MKNDETNAVIPLISEMEISAISDGDLEAAFLAVVSQHKDAVASIHQSMADATEAYAKYLDPGYIPLEDVAKKDRAVLNKSEKNIAEKYASLKAAYEKPLESIEANIRSIRSAIKGASGVVDGAVKSYEEGQKEAKRREIQAYFETKGFDLVPFEKMFNHRWLNKTCGMAEARKEIDDTITSIYGNIKTLESISEYGVIAKSSYLETLDMGTALRRVEALKENAERLAREKVEREERERQAQIEANAEELLEERRNESITRAKNERVQDLVSEALGIDEPEAREPELIEYTLRFKGTKEQLYRLREYMNASGITYTKLEGGRQ